MDQKTQQRSKTTYFILVGMSTSILLATPVIVLLGLGYLLDRLFNTSPYLTIGGGSIGFVSGIVNVYKLLMRMNTNNKATKT
jgi:F0F1-type ATP synthase assembly protein I